MPAISWSIGLGAPCAVGSPRTIRRDQRRFEEGGLAALGHPGGYPPNRPRPPASRRRWVQQLKRQGCSQREIARRIGVGENAVRKLLRRLGWKVTAPLQTDLPFADNVSAHPNLSGFCSVANADPVASRDSDPKDRGADRLLARLGLLEDAPPLFGSAAVVPRAGVPLAPPVLIASGVFECAQKIYGGLGPAFYGLRTSLLTLLLMALWRIKRPEGLKEYSPAGLGRVLGLDRAPEVKTPRRKLARRAAAGRATQFGQALAQQRAAARGAALGFKTAHGKLGRQLADAWQKVQQLEKRRAAIPKRVPVQSLTDEPVVQLAPERKHLTHLIKRLAYQAESDLLRLAAPHYRRADDEGRTLIQSALTSAADLEVTQKELRVTLAAPSSPHRRRAVAELCQELNTVQTFFPGSQLRLRYAIREAS